MLLLRRRSSVEVPPREAATEVSDALGPRGNAFRPAEVGFVGSTAAPRAMRPVAVVPADEIGGEAIDLVEGRQQPHQAEGGLLEGLEEALDAAVGPGMGGVREGLFHARVCQKLLHRVRREDGAAVAENAQRFPMACEGAVEGAGDFRGGRPAQTLEGHHAAAVVVDNAEEPHGDEAQDPHHGQVGAPEVSRAGDGDALWFAASLLVEGDDQIATPDQNSANGSATRAEPKNALAEEAELTGAEESLLDMEADELLFKVVRRTVPRATATTGEGRRLSESVPHHPASPYTSERATPSAKSARQTAAKVIDGQGQAHEHTDEQQADAVEGVDGGIHGQHFPTRGEWQLAASCLGLVFPALVGIALGACNLGDASRAQEGPVRIGDTFLDVASVQAYVARVPGSARKAAPELVNDLVRFELLAQEAERRGHGQSPDVERARKQQMITAMARDEAARGGAAPTDAELQRYYQDHYAEFHRQDQLRLGQIVCADRRKATKAATEAREADESGFRAIVEKYSEDGVTKAVGGSLGWVDRMSDKLPVPVRSAIAAMFDKGEVAGPVESNGKFYVLKLFEVRPGFSRAFTEVREAIRVRLARQAEQTWLDKMAADLRAKTKVEVDEKAIQDIVAKGGTPSAGPGAARGGAAP